MSQFFSTEGFYEDICEGAKYLGKRGVDWPERKLGSDGMIEQTITEPIVLTRNLKAVVIRASKTHPLQISSIIFPLCGRVLTIGSHVRVRRTDHEQAYALAPKEGQIIAFEVDPITKAERPGYIVLKNGEQIWTEEFWRLQLIK